MELLLEGRHDGELRAGPSMGEGTGGKRVVWCGAARGVDSWEPLLNLIHILLPTSMIIITIIMIVIMMMMMIMIVMTPYDIFVSFF